MLGVVNNCNFLLRNKYNEEMMGFNTKASLPIDKIQ